MTILDDIKSSVEKRVGEKKVGENYLSELELKLESALERKPLEFPEAAEKNTVIAEVKFASPSSGAIANPDNLEDIIKTYVDGGSACISVLTEPEYFNGSLDYLKQARRLADVPLLRKDFIVDELQVREARAYGADGLLLIAGIRGKEQLEDLLNKTRELSMWTLVEVHSREELDSVLKTEAEIIGVNNRNLKTMEVDLDTSVELSKMIPSDRKFVVESGIKSADDLRYLKNNCFRKPDAYLVGSSLMKTEDRVGKLRELVDA